MFDLLGRLKDIIEEDLAGEAAEKDSQLSNRFLARTRTFEDRVVEVFKLAYQTDFNDNETGAILKSAFEEEKDPELLQILENYLSHNDYLKLKNEMTDFAHQKGSQEQPPAFNSLADAIIIFKDQGHITEEDAEILLGLESQNNRKLMSVWNAFQVIKSVDDLLHSLKVFAELRAKKEA